MDKKKRRRRESYKLFIHRLLKVVAPKHGITNKALNIMDSFVNDMFVRLAETASHLAVKNKRSTIINRDLEGAVRLLCTGELQLHAVSNGTKAFSKYSSRK
ncbi:histone H2B-like [Homarus americanus]|uniref:histone H2B-like n=1 Tax=Homarus americanus TaxID=6706 RepID=UPI001C4679FC|nr:histone H2B-like [Homarus americanus]